MQCSERSLSTFTLSTCVFPKLFEHILHREFQHGPTKHLSRKFTEWVYGPVHSSLYDLADLDSCQDQSVLEILVYGTDIPVRHKSTKPSWLNPA